MSKYVKKHFTFLCLLFLVNSLLGKEQPNFIIIFTDDQGYSDLSCYGGQHVSTPHIDQMAAAGVKMTNFYVAAPVCTPSRAALMTGCYPNRIDMETGSHFGVLLAGDTKGLNPSEITIAEVLKEAGYKTGIFGKWHLGDQKEFLPTRQGFDEFFGIPYSHDIHPYHPRQDRFKFPPLPLLEGETVIEMDPDARFLTKRFTERAIQFIEKHQEQPFFVYLPHPIPHKPLFVSPKYMESVSSEIKTKLDQENGQVDYRTRNLLFKQAISEIDDSVGQIIETLEKLQLDKKTVILFSTDNGPSIGQAKPLKGKKGSTYEGGMRVPGILYYPDTLKPHINHELMSTIDILPTFAALAQANVPNDRILDGKNIWPTLQQTEKTPHQTFFYKNQAMRYGNWKIHFKGKKAIELYHLEKDISEQKNVLKQHPEIVEKLTTLFNSHLNEVSQNKRPAAYVKEAAALSN